MINSIQPKNNKPHFGSVSKALETELRRAAGDNVRLNQEIDTIVQEARRNVVIEVDLLTDIEKRLRDIPQTIIGFCNRIKPQYVNRDTPLAEAAKLWRTNIKNQTPENLIKDTKRMVTLAEKNVEQYYPEEYRRNLSR